MELHWINSADFAFKDLVNIVMTLLWWMGAVKSRYQFINFSWGFLSTVTHCSVLKYWQHYYLNINVFKTYFSRFLTTSAEHLFRRAPPYNCFWQYISGKTVCPFSTNFDSLRKACLRTCLLLFWNAQ